MIGVPITIKNHETGETIVLNDHTTDPGNVIALQSFPSFESDVRAQNIPRQGAHGEFRLPIYYSGMSIVLQGVIACDNESNVWDIKRQLDSVMSLSRKGFPNKYTGNDTFPPMFNNTIRLSFTAPDGKVLFVDATPIKAVSYDRSLMEKYKLTFQVIVRSSMPYLVVVDDEPNIETGTIGRISKGLLLPTTLPLSLGEEVTENEITITMNTPGYAVVTLNGSADGIIINPKITNITNGTSVKIRKALGNASQYFLIDGLYQTMKDENGASVLQYSDGDYIYLEAGENVLIYTADAIIAN